MTLLCELVLFPLHLHFWFHTKTYFTKLLSKLWKGDHGDAGLQGAELSIPYLITNWCV